MGTGVWGVRRIGEGSRGQGTYTVAAKKETFPGFSCSTVRWVDSEFASGG